MLLEKIMVRENNSAAFSTLPFLLLTQTFVSQADTVAYCYKHPFQGEMQLPFFLRTIYGKMLALVSKEQSNEHRLQSIVHALLTVNTSFLFSEQLPAYLNQPTQFLALDCSNHRHEYFWICFPSFLMRWTSCLCL